jgi:L-lactate dehydrogenase complex protein LldF
MIPTFADLGLMWQMLSTSGTGQTITVYNTVLTGPKKASEADGPEEMYVVLLDNGRTDLLADEEKRSALKCIRCGACLNICPVYKNIGGHTYKTTYSGPIGSVISPQFLGMKEYKHLSYASSLCGACTTVCPVKIPIHELLLLNRNQSVKENPGAMEKFGFRMWKKAMLNRKIMNQVKGNIKSTFANLLFPAWRKRRSNIKVAPKSFNELWKERRR